MSLKAHRRIRACLPPPEIRYSEVNSGGFSFGVAFSHFVLNDGQILNIGFVCA